MVLLSLDSGQGMHPNSLDKVRVRAVGPSWATTNVPGNRGGLKKKQRQRQATNPEENSQKENERPSTNPEKNRQRPPDHQARRRSRKETLTHPFPSGAKRKGESYWPARRKNAVDEDSQDSPTAKTCSSYEKKPARTKKYQKNRDSF